MVDVVVVGCAGRMGKHISRLALQHKNIRLVGGSETKGHYAVGADIGEVAGVAKAGVLISETFPADIKKGAVVVDFTSPSATLEHLKIARKNQYKVVIGTTGFTATEEKKIHAAAQDISIVFAPNMSVGVNLLFKVSQMVAAVLNDEYDVEIVEAHHKYKKDAPSGTALGLARHVAAGRGVDLKKMAIYGREGLCGERTQGTIGIHAVRGGDVVGDHTVSFMTEGERIELGHRASSRDAFAKGSLVAAQFLSKKSKGLYTMQDVLGLN